MALPADRYELRPLIEVLEGRGSTNFCWDAGRITMTTWERWAVDGLTAEEAMTVANHLGLSAGEIWEDWPDVPTWIAAARQSLEEIGRQEAS